MTDIDLNKRLDVLASLKENWDSYGGSPITEKALRIARLMLTAPTIVPMSCGGIQLEWHKNGMDIEIAINEDGVIDDTYIRMR